MPVRQEFKYTNPTGEPVVYFNHWLATLPISEQQEYLLAQQRQTEYRQQCIDKGLLVLGTTGSGHQYVWRDADTAATGKPMDAVWGMYWKRYLSETGTIFEIIETEEKVMLTVYTKNDCPFCDRTKALLESKAVEYRTVNVEDDELAREMLRDLGLRSVPQIFNGTTLLPGGYQGLAGQSADFWTQYTGASC